MPRRKALETYSVVSLPGHVSKFIRPHSIDRSEASSEDVRQLKSISDADELTKNILYFLIEEPDHGYRDCRCR